MYQERTIPDNNYLYIKISEEGEESMEDSCTDPADNQPVPGMNNS